MSLVLGTHKGVRPLLQSESSECGLACLAMILGSFGRNLDINTLRGRYGPTTRGTTLQRLVEIGGQEGLECRPLRVEVEDLAELGLPCILHWNMNHFVVLVGTSRGRYQIIDPAVGSRFVSAKEMSASFTGVALECAPSAVFEKAKKPEGLSLRRLLGSVKGLKRGVSLLLLMSVVLQALSLLAPLLTQVIIDSVVISADTGLLLTICVAMIAVVCLQVSINAARTWASLFLGAELGYFLTAGVLRKLLWLPASFFQSRSMGDLISRLGSVQAIKDAATSLIVGAILDTAMVITMLAAILVYSPLLASVSLLAFAAYSLLRVASAQWLRLASQEDITLSAKESSQIFESLRGYLTVQANGLEDFRHVQWKGRAIDSINQRLRIGRVNMGIAAASQGLQGFERAVVIGLGAAMVIDGSFTVGMLVAYLAYMTLFSTRAGSLLDTLLSVHLLRVHVDRVSEVFLTDSRPQRGNSFIPSDAGVGLVARQISYQYSVGESPIFEDLSLEVKPGEFLVVVGPSGCGKSTLLKVLIGMLPTSSGSVSLGGFELEKIDHSSLKGTVASVMQEDQLFAGTVAENIAIGEWQPDQKRMLEAAELAAIRSEIELMPMGFSTMVGDMGVAFSSGQKQRIILARALYRSPKVIFLDEATSHLDEESARHVLTSLRSLGATVICATHDRSVVKIADKILHMPCDGASPSTDRSTEVSP